MIKTEVTERVFFNINEAAKIPGCTPRELLNAGGHKRMLLCILCRGREFSIFPFNPLWLPEFANVRNLHYAFPRDARTFEGEEIYGLILSSEDCIEILRTGHQLQNTFQTGYKLEGNDLHIIPDQTMEEPIKEESYFEKPDDPDDHSDVMVSIVDPPPKLIWRLHEHGSNFSDVEFSRKLKFVKITESDVFISNVELERYKSGLHNNGESKIPHSYINPKYPKKLNVLMTIYMDNWSKEALTLSLDTSGQQRDRIIEIENRAARELVKNKYLQQHFPKGEKESAFLKCCLALIRPDDLRSGQEKAYLNRSKLENFRGHFNTTLNLLADLAERLKITEETPNNCPNRNVLIDELVSLGLSQNLAGVSAAILRPLSAPRGRKKNLNK